MSSSYTYEKVEENDEEDPLGIDKLLIFTYQNVSNIQNDSLFRDICSDMSSRRSCSSSFEVQSDPTPSEKNNEKCTTMTYSSPTSKPSISDGILSFKRFLPGKLEEEELDCKREKSDTLCRSSIESKKKTKKETAYASLESTQQVFGKICSFMCKRGRPIENKRILFFIQRASNVSSNVETYWKEYSDRVSLKCFTKAINMKFEKSKKHISVREIPDESVQDIFNKNIHGMFVLYAQPCSEVESCYTKSIVMLINECMLYYGGQSYSLNCKQKTLFKKIHHIYQVTITNV
jgi:hypothetical protein